MRLNRSLLVFLAIVVLIAGSAFWFCGSQLALAFPFGGPGVWGAWIWALALWLFPLIRVIFFREKAGRLQGLAFFMMGMAATFLILLLVLRLAGLALGWEGRYWPSWAPWVMLACAAVLSLWGMQEAFGPALVRRIKLPTPGLHPDLEGLRIVQISDLHVNHFTGAAQVARLVEQVEALKPDLIAITGDLVDGPLDQLREAAAPMAGLKAPLGVHYVTGNHEYFWGVDGWLREFAGLGFTLLLNGHRILEHKRAKILVLGVNDPTALRMEQAGPDLEQARAGAPAADYTILLAHQPQAYTMAEAAGADLFLAGHTHGGQFFPFPPIVSLFHRYFRGLYRHGGRMHVYIHSGSGFWGPPNRLGVPPEIALLILEASPL
jgi:predicted MPP superfamily phosphohydrolase